MSNKYIEIEASEDMVLAINEGDSIEGMHPANLVAEYCFGNIDQSTFIDAKDKIEHFNFDACEYAFRKAIKFGLTHEISTSDTKKAELIWDMVSVELGIDSEN